MNFNFTDVVFINDTLNNILTIIFILLFVTYIIFMYRSLLKMLPDYFYEEITGKVTRNQWLDPVGSCLKIYIKTNDERVSSLLFYCKERPTYGGQRRGWYWEDEWISRHLITATSPQKILIERDRNDNSHLAVIFDGLYGKVLS